MDTNTLTPEQSARIWQRIKERITMDDMMDMDGMMTAEPEIDEHDSGGFVPVLLNQEEAGYVVPAPASEVCGACRFFMGEGMCHLVASYPLPIVANGYCTWFDGVPVEAEEMPMEVTIVEAESQNVDNTENQDYNTEQEGKERKQRWKLSNLFRRIPAFDKNLTKYGSGFKVLGDGLWMATYTNNFEDRDGEILSEAAHDRYIARVQGGFVDMPELWHWHLPGTKHGQAIWVDRIGHMVYAIGRFTNDDVGRAAEQHYQKYAHLYKLSHGFKYPVWAKEDGVYLDYNTFEITTLPIGKALESNPFTEFEVMNMALDPMKKTSIEKLFGPAASKVIAQVEGLEESGKAIEELGAKYKDYADVTVADVARKAQTAGAATQDVTTLLVDMIDVQAKVMEILPAMDKRSDAQIAELKGIVEKAVGDFTAKATELTAALADIKSYRPRSVTETPEIKDAEIVDKLTQQQGVEYDPMFPGMKVPMSKTNGKL